MKIAVITGASSGIGAALAHILDKSESHLDEIWLVARREHLLVALSDKLSVRTRIIPVDITKKSNINKIRYMLKLHKANVRFLVNAAGVGRLGHFEFSKLSEQLEMTDVNCRALIALCFACLPHMKRGARMINFSSSAAFMPQADFAVYAASKAFVLSFSRALNEELRTRKISVTAVCPGPVDTPFFKKAEAHGSTLAIKRYICASAEDVAAHAFASSLQRKQVAVYSLPVKGLRFITKFLPHSLLLVLARFLSANK